jgi:hypothetical protein
MAHIARHQGVVAFQYQRSNQRIGDAEAVGQNMGVEQGDRTLRRGGCQL